MSTANDHRSLPREPWPPHSCFDRGLSPTTPSAITAMYCRAWHDQGVAMLQVDEISDPLLRQAIVNEAIRRWGRRNGGKLHGR
jgi:hypothetical protein